MRSSVRSADAAASSARLGDTVGDWLAAAEPAAAGLGRLLRLGKGTTLAGADGDDVMLVVVGGG